MYDAVFQTWYSGCNYNNMSWAGRMRSGRRKAPIYAAPINTISWQDYFNSCMDIYHIYIMYIKKYVLDTEQISDHQHRCLYSVQWTIFKQLTLSSALLFLYLHIHCLVVDRCIFCAQIIYNLAAIVKVIIISNIS